MKLTCHQRQFVSWLKAEECETQIVQMGNAGHTIQTIWEEIAGASFRSIRECLKQNNVTNTGALQIRGIRGPDKTKRKQRGRQTPEQAITRKERRREKQTDEAYWTNMPSETGL